MMITTVPPNSWHSALFGIKINFIQGLHIIFPASNRVFHLRLTNLVNNKVLAEGDIHSRPNQSISYDNPHTFYLPYMIEIFQAGKLVYRYQLDLIGQPVCLNFLPGAMGDMVAWMTAAVFFQQNQHCKLTIVMKKEFIEMFESVYPDIRFITLEQYNHLDYLACYPVGVWGNGNTNNEPTDFQKDNLIQHAGNILGMRLPQLPPRLAPAQKDCAKEYGKYVCIATRASRTPKHWHNPDGWSKVTDELKKMGYRVFCIDGDNKAMPSNAEDFTGMKPLRERIDLLRGCQFFIGLPSGLSWIAWACEKPVIMISGCTEPFTEFANPYRVQTTCDCHGCYNRVDMRGDDFQSCPEKKDYICTKAITPEEVMTMVRKVITEKKLA